MSGSHRATAYPSYEPMYEAQTEAGYGVPQQSYGVYEQPAHPAYEEPGHYGRHAEDGHTDGYGVAYDTGSFPTGAYGTGGYDTGSFPTVGHGNGGHGTGPYDTGSYDTGSYDTGAFETGAYDTGSFGTGAYDTGSFQTGAYDTGAYDSSSYDDGVYGHRGEGHAPAGYEDLPGDEDVYDRPFQPVTAPAVVPEPVVLAASAVPAAAAEGRAAARGHRRRAKKKRTTGKAVTAGTALLLAAAAGWYTVGQDGATKPGVTTADGPGPDPVAVPDQAGQPQATTPQAAADTHTEAPRADRGDARPDVTGAGIPGLGPAFLAKIPADTKQVVLATGQGKDTNKASVTLWTRGADGRWQPGETWQGHNAYKGWTTDHNEGDLRSPIGVFSLTDAGGRKADPGSKLPYDKDPLFVVSGTGFAGEQLSGSFDYVVAINYNRVAGNSPLDPRRPSGSTKGGGIWIHVDHGGPTHGCVSIPEDKMAQLIRTLDPAAKPVIVMGDATSLAA